ncbi:MAG: acyl-CoA dehydrogenase family protein [Acidimicrobiaceae bacterium]|nr:acyl-CoA dehydrogenase family protein [Acidimicrobiaceae bacterium]
MDFRLTDHHEALRSEIRACIRAHIDDEVIERAHRTGANHCVELAKALGDAGLLGKAMPGEGQDPMVMWMLSSEAEKAGAPFDSVGMALVIAGVLNEAGTAAQNQRVTAALLAGEEFVCFGLTEPDGGSDLPAITTRAVRDGDEWVINGSKMWTTMAQVSDWVFLLTRTDSNAGRYGGFTVFIIPMDTPGITIDPIHTMSTERSNATFYDDVRVGDEWVVGEANEGWRVVSIMFGFERGMANTGALTPLLRRFSKWAEASGVIADPVHRERMAQVAIDAQVAELLTQRTAWTAAIGEPSGMQGSIAKVFATEAYQRHSRWAQAAAGPEGLLGLNEPGAAAEGWIDHDVRHSVPQTFQGGTTEINRNNIAERHLNLPRAR